MTKLMTTMTISVIASILVIGALIASPDAYSAKNKDVPDECSCEKPDTLKVSFSAPVGKTDQSFRIDIFKKLEDRNDPDKLPLITFDTVKHGAIDDLVISAIIFGKDKLESNTAFVVYNESDGLLVALMEIHTSCSKPLFKGLMVMDNGYSLKVTDGLIGGSMGTTSIPLFEPSTCEDKKLKSIGSITIKKAITNDNGGIATPADFEITITNVETDDDIILVHDQDESMNPLINVNQVPAGTYKISETSPDGYTTVLIAGDTSCPSMLDEVFTIKKGKHLSCIIYNDDNGDGSGGTGGIVFRNFSMKVQLDESTLFDSCDQFPDAADKDPCIQIVNFENGDIAIVDSALVSTTTIILFSVVQEELDPMEGAPEPDCTLDRIIRHNSQSDSLEDDMGDPIVNPSDNIVVLLQCLRMDLDRVYNVNYVMIDPTM